MLKVIHQGQQRAKSRCFCVCSERETARHALRSMHRDDGVVGAVLYQNEQLHTTHGIYPTHHNSVYGQYCSNYPSTSSCPGQPWSAAGYQGQIPPCSAGVYPVQPTVRPGQMNNDGLQSLPYQQFTSNTPGGASFA